MEARGIVAGRVVRRAAVIAGHREAQAVAATLGGTVRASRVGKHLTLEALARKVGLSRARLSQIERGEGTGAPLQTWIALGVALGRPLAVTFSRPLGEPRGLADAGHLDIQEYVLRLARQTGRHGTFELPTRPTDPAHSTDVGLRDDRHRVLIQVECWNTFGDMGAAVRATTRKSAEAATHAVATMIDDAEPYRAASVWVVRATTANRTLLARFPNIIDAAFPGSSRAWCRALSDGAEPPVEPGIVWFDPATHRLTEHRRPRWRDPR
jgi:transcriptional regulator with XRE-family HTH domain